MATPAASQATVLYDGECAFCRKSVSILQKLDWLKALRYQNGREVEKLPATEPPLQPERLIEEMHLVTPDGLHVYAGFAAFRWMAWRLPLLWIIAPFLYLPGVPWLGNKVYLWIARNRFKLAPCKDGACELPLRKPSA
jgi:predicted DCC family thiol-disulfide oxidoreductase YuxK